MVRDPFQPRQQAEASECFGYWSSHGSESVRVPGPVRNNTRVPFGDGGRYSNKREPCAEEEDFVHQGSTLMHVRSVRHGKIYGHVKHSHNPGVRDGVLTHLRELMLDEYQRSNVSRFAEPWSITYNRGTCRSSWATTSQRHQRGRRRNAANEESNGPTFHAEGPKLNQ